MISRVYYGIRTMITAKNKFHLRKFVHVVDKLLPSDGFVLSNLKVGQPRGISWGFPKPITGARNSAPYRMYFYAVRFTFLGSFPNLRGR